MQIQRSLYLLKQISFQLRGVYTPTALYTMVILSLQMLFQSSLLILLLGEPAG